MGERFKVAKGQMLVIDSDNRATWRDVLLIHDTENKHVGVQLIGESPLKGFTFFVPEESFQAVKASGKPTNRLRVI